MWTAWQPYWVLWSWLPSFPPPPTISLGELPFYLLWVKSAHLMHTCLLHHSWLRDKLSRQQKNNRLAIYGLLVGLQAVLLSSLLHKCAKQKESKGPFAFHRLNKFEISEPEGCKHSENSEALSGHSFCFFGTECLEVQGQLGRLAGRVEERGKSRRQRERERERERKEGSAL